MKIKPFAIIHATQPQTAELFMVYENGDHFCDLPWPEDFPPPEDITRTELESRYFEVRIETP